MSDRAGHATQSLTGPMIPRYRSVGRMLPMMLVLAAGCISAGERSRPLPGEDGPDGSGTFLLYVDNESTVDARVVAMWNGTERLLGVVRGERTERFVMPRAQEGFRLRVEFLAGGAPRYETPLMQAPPGGSMRYRIPR